MNQAKETRRDRAAERKLLRDARLPQEQLALLEAGGHGHCSEAKRLRAQIQASGKERNQK